MDENTLVIGIFEAKKHLSRLLDTVQEGTILTITNRGTPIAQIVPYREPRHTPMDDVIDRFRRIRSAVKSSDNVKDYIRAGRDH